MKYIFLLVTVFFSCTSTTKTAAVQKGSFEQLISEKFKGDVTLNYNKNRDLVICKDVQNPKALPTYNAKKFVVYNLKDNLLLYEDSYVSGSAEWIGDMKIKIVKGLGTITAEHPEGYVTYIYDIESGTKIEESSKTK